MKKGRGRDSPLARSLSRHKLSSLFLSLHCRRSNRIFIRMTRALSRRSGARETHTERDNLGAYVYVRTYVCPRWDISRWRELTWACIERARERERNTHVSSGRDARARGESCAHERCTCQDTPESREQPRRTKNVYVCVYRYTWSLSLLSASSSSSERAFLRVFFSLSSLSPYREPLYTRISRAYVRVCVCVPAL